MKKKSNKQRMKQNEKRAYGWPEMRYFQLGYLTCLRHNNLLNKDEAKELREFVSLTF